MFTGLIETTGDVKRIGVRSNYKVFTVGAVFEEDDLKIGESIACDGACLTVVAFGKDEFVVEASQESLKRSILSGYHVGSKINLERALKTGDRLGGHFVSGHVDTVGTVDYLKRVGESFELAVSYDAEYDELVVEKGSIAINGVSLTVNACKPGWLMVNLIPHTLKSTNLENIKNGERVNLEFDMIGKFVNKKKNIESTNNITIDKLKESGW